jgi:phosphate transport system protein
MSEHIVKSFDDDLVVLRSKISEMGGIAEGMLSDALTSVRDREPELAEKVVAIDEQLDQLERIVDEMATQVIARRQPMAQDLRFLVAVLKVAAVMERVGDLAKSIARRGVHLSTIRPIGIISSVIRMGHDVLRQLTRVLDAWAQHDVEAAVLVWRKDVEIDEAYNSLFREVMTYMMEDPRTISIGSQLLFIAKNLERIGDHATRVAEMIHYIEKATPLGEERPKGDPAGLEDG